MNLQAKICLQNEFHKNRIYGGSKVIEIRMNSFDFYNLIFGTIQFQ